MEGENFDNSCDLEDDLDFALYDDDSSEIPLKDHLGADSDVIVVRKKNEIIESDSED